MFDSDLDRKTTRDGVTDPRRRVFLASATAAVAGFAFWQWKNSSVVKVAAAADNRPNEVTIVLFSDGGARLDKVHDQYWGPTSCEAIWSYGTLDGML